MCTPRANFYTKCNNMKSSVNIVLYKQKKLKNGEHPILLVLTKNRKRKKISLGVSSSIEYWNDAMSMVNHLYPNYEIINKKLLRAKNKAESILFHFEDIDKDFSLDEFERKYKGINTGDVFEYFKAVIERLRSTGKIGNSLVYAGTRNTVQKFHKKKSLSFTDVNYRFLILFEEHLRARGNLNNSISLHMRTIRSLFNRAIKEEVCNPSVYPFKVYKISRLKNETSKLAISKEDILKINQYIPTPNTKEAMSRDIFMFSFYTMGMNYCDIAKLKHDNIYDGRINYIRSKTGKRFSIKILPPVQEIIEKYKKTDDTNQYIFPILDDSYQDPNDIRNRIKSGLKRLNMHLKIIGREMGVKKSLTSYVARHSWATLMKNSGVSTSVISEGLGHSSEEVTQIYLDSFENKVLDAANELLLA